MDASRVCGFNRRKWLLGRYLMRRVSPLVHTTRCESPRAEVCDVVADLDGEGSTPYFSSDVGTTTRTGPQIDRGIEALIS